ncbi:MAG: copper homeostasis protein CutC [Bacteroidia bacterium]|nr:copper homeostasis protein CutC [Bacteroidia bacterium]
MSHFLEVACFNEASAILAQENGADRIELCAHRELDGISPPLQWISELKKHLHIPMFVMVRPRGGNFVYSNEEFESMKIYLQQALQAGADGFVFGCLQANFGLNLDQNKALIELANELPCTLHKAFDLCDDLEKTINEAIQLGFRQILSSGGMKTALEGAQVLSKLILKYSQKLEIMPGANVRSTNLAEIKNICRAKWYHSSAIIDSSTLPDAQEIQALKKA